MRRRNDGLWGKELGRSTGGTIGWEVEGPPPLILGYRDDGGSYMGVSITTMWLLLACTVDPLYSWNCSPFDPILKERKTNCINSKRNKEILGRANQEELWRNMKEMRREDWRHIKKKKPIQDVIHDVWTLRNSTIVVSKINCFPRSWRNPRFWDLRQFYRYKICNNKLVSHM